MLKVDANPRRAHAMPFGAQLQRDGTVRFRLWAPSHREIQIQLDGPTNLDRRAEHGGWHELVTDRARGGTLYQFVLPDGLRVPDPASRYQPDDVHGPSEVIDPKAYAWRDRGWNGRPWHEAVLYELHIGAFTAAGTFLAAVEKLDHLASLGITALEIMPVADFPGRRNWGYDGVLPFAPDSTYGHPNDLKRFIQSAHDHGIMVLLAVVYNHFGPEGNYLNAYAPQFFTDRHRTPWGKAINFDGPESHAVRDFFIHNALYWLTEYRFDGLRLDAVPAILDDSPKHFLTELAEEVRKAIEPDRCVHLILENEFNQSRYLQRTKQCRAELYDAQWNDDIHHALHVLVTGEKDGYYSDHSDRPLERLGRCLCEGFDYQGETSLYRNGHPRGER